MRALSWRRASAGAGLLCYRCIQIAPECSSAGSEQALQTLRDRFPRRIRWVCAYHVLIARRAQFAHRKLTGKNRSWSNTRGRSRCRGVEEGPTPLSSAHTHCITQAVRKIIVAGCKQRPFWAASAIGAAWIGSNERHGHGYATIGDYISLCQQLSAAPKHRAC
jgi:hypothetical protein